MPEDDYNNQVLDLTGEIQEDVSAIETSGAVVQPDVAEIKVDVETLKTDVKIVQPDVATMKGSLATLQADAALIKADVDTTQADVATIKGDITLIKADVDTTQADVALVKADIATIKADVALMKVVLDEIGDVINAQHDALKVMSHAEDELHEGNVYKAHNVLASVANNGYQYFEIIVPADVHMHLAEIYVWTDADKALIEIISNATLTHGTAGQFVPRQMNELSGKTSVVEIWLDPTTTSGTADLYRAIGAGKQVRAASDGPDEAHFGQGTHLVRVQNLGGSAKNMSCYITWMEEDA